MICNAEGGMCIAGVFGGLHSGVTSSTTDVFLESAYFEAIGIRRTSTRHLLRTDAATHYEKGCDPNITIEALKRAALLMVEFAGGKLESPIQDMYPNKIDPFKVAFRPNRLNALAGISIDTKIVETALAALEIEIDSKDGDTWNLKVPTYRSDVKREADVIEEVLRIFLFQLSCTAIWRMEQRWKGILPG
jgi:phenylalanyl-tRNA synthetase beta chain